MADAVSEGTKAIVTFDAKPIADVSNNLINKVADAIGWIVAPKGVRKDQIEAKDLFVEQIRGNPTLTPFQKAAFISNSKKLLKEYKNQNDIFQMALEQLDGRAQLENEAQPHKLEDDWISNFFEGAKHVSQNEMQVLWSKILVRECEQPGSISKSLLHILSILSSDLANIFNTICNCTFNKDADFPDTFIDIATNSIFYDELDLRFENLTDLESIGLIKFSDVTLCDLEREMKFNYFSSSYTIRNKKGTSIDIGNVILTRDGISLFKIIDQEPIDGILSIFESYMKYRGYEVISD